MSKIVFMSRGHGFGHAARDLPIIEAIRRSRPDMQVVLASSGTGVEYFRARSIPCVDLDIDDHDDMSRNAGERVRRFLVSQLPMDLVVADEVLWGVLLCRQLFDVDCVLLTNWLFSEIGRPDHNRILNQAGAIVMPDFPDVHPDLADITVPVHFAGPLARAFTGDRRSARRELGVPEDALVAVATLGGMHTRPEAREFMDRALTAWSANAGPGDRMIVLADPIDGAPRTGTVHWAGTTRNPDPLYLAADVVLADAKGFTICEMARNGVPTVATTGPWLNLSDWYRAELLESSGFLSRAFLGTGPDELWRQLTTAAGTVGQPREQPSWGDNDEVAALVLGRLG